jgi:hypothetical protein
LLHAYCPVGQACGAPIDCFQLENTVVQTAMVSDSALHADFIPSINLFKEPEMKASKILAAAAFSLLAVAGAQAESYDGVHPLTSGASRAEVASQAVTAAQAGNQYGDVAGGGAQAINSTADREKVYQDAVAKAHDPFASLDRRAFFRDQVPDAYKKPKMSFSRQAGL